MKADDLKGLHDACRRVLRNIEGRDEQFAEEIRSTCRAIEARLTKLGMSFDSVFTKRTQSGLYPPTRDSVNPTS